MSADARSGRDRRRGERRASFTAPAADAELLTAGGWTLLIHPLLLDQLEKLTAAAEAERANDPGRAPGANAKLLGHLMELVFVKIPQNPGDAAYRQGKTLGPDLTNWFRGKTGNGRYRLFFRYDSVAMVIVYAWVNDEETKRTYGSATDAYAVFRRMVLHDKNPPNDWNALVAAAKQKDTVQRARNVAVANERRGS